jgi:hypothetical protein
MKHFVRVMLLTLGWGLCAVIVSVLASHHAAAAAPGAPATAVDVENTPTVNAHITNTSVPVTGSVNAAVTGTVSIGKGIAVLNLNSIAEPAPLSYAKNSSALTSSRTLCLPRTQAPQRLKRVNELRSHVLSGT